MIREWIGALAKIDGPDFGFSGTMTGTAFLPAPNSGEFQMGVLMNHDLKSSPELKLLVQNGVDTLPFLLEALDDKTPTKFTIGGNNAFGFMSLEHEIRGNPLNPRESPVLTANEKDPSADSSKGISEHLITVGDVCFVAIGQIVGRPYRAVRYQPTFCVYINSPTDDPLLCEQVRQIWKNEDSAKTLFTSLLLDYSTREVVGPVSWGMGSYFQNEAAMRLLYYFPRESEELIASRLQGLSIYKRATLGTETLDAQKELYSVDVRELISHLGWIEAPKVKQIIQDVFQHTDDEGILIAAIPAMRASNPDAVISRITDFFDKRANENSDGLGFDYMMMQALIREFGERARPTMEKLLKNATASRSHNFIHALQSTEAPWALPILLQLLDDKRPAPGFVYRVCDGAAMAIANSHPESKFEWQEKAGDRDKKIEAMRKSVKQAATELKPILP